MQLDTHPFLTGNYTGYNVLPVQAISTKEKLKGKTKTEASFWEKQNLDALEMIAWRQYQSNHRFLINEKIVNGEFISSDYFECEDDQTFLEPLELLIRDGKVPRFIKNYNIVGKIINVMVSIFEDYPDTFSIVGYGDVFQSEKSRTQAELLKQWFDAKIEEKINGILEEPQEGDTPEITQQLQDEYQQQRSELVDYLTPEDIGQYMKDFRHDYELWAEYKKLDYHNKYNLPKLRKNEYRDYIIQGVRARHYRINNYGLQQESINPRNLFFELSDGIDYIQDGSYAGIIYKATPQRLLDLFSSILTAEEVDKVNQVYSNFVPEGDGPKAKDLFGNSINYMPINGVPYNTKAPYNNETLNRIAPNLGMNYSNINPFDHSDIYNVSIFSSDFIVTEAYWKTQEQVWTMSWINPENNLQEVIEVDETFVFPNYIRKVTNQPAVGEIQFNTAIKNYKTVIYKGIKIRMPNQESLYKQTGVCDYQKTSPYLPVPKLPIFGQISNNRGVQVKGIVEDLKPYIFLHNIAMNKATKLQELGYVPFVLMDMKILPKDKDWGGEDGLYKWLTVAQSGGIGPVDTSIINTMGDPSEGGQFPRVIDIDLTPRVIQQYQIAQSIVAAAYEQIGISPQLLGSVRATETATGINQSIVQSQHSISRWITEFYECEREMLQYSIEVAQWLEANNKEISVEFVNSDFTSGLLKIANANFSLFDWRTYIVNSKEELRRKKIAEDLALNMNTLPINTSDRLEMTNQSTPMEKIINIIKDSEDKVQQQQAQQAEMQMQQMQAREKAEADKLVREMDMLKLKLANEKEVAYIKSRGYLGAEGQDLDANKIPDAFEYAKFQEQSSNNLQKLGLTSDKLALDREKENNRKTESEQKFQLEQEKLRIKEEERIQTAKNVKILDKGKFSQ